MEPMRHLPERPTEPMRHLPRPDFPAKSAQLRAEAPALEASPDSRAIQRPEPVPQSAQGLALKLAVALKLTLELPPTIALGPSQTMPRRRP
jgi:hypothetical protein